MDKNKLAEEYINIRYSSEEKAWFWVAAVRQAFLAGFDACLSELSKTKVRKKTSEPELSLEAKAFVAKMFPCEPPCDSYGVCSNCCEASVLYAGYNMGLSASESIANAKIQRLEFRLKQAKGEIPPNEVFEYSHKELGFEQAGRNIYVGLMNEHAWYKNQHSRITELEQQLKKAESVIEFYGDKNNWREGNATSNSVQIAYSDFDNSLAEYRQYGGKLARQYLKSRGD